MAIDIRKRDIANIVIPDYITDNLAFELREYQKEAIARFLYYYNNPNYDSEDNEAPHSPHLIWQMATGSGKTLIMAALILEMYQKGYRNFWFFVNSTDIITKTIDNFTNSSAKKHQFAQHVEIDGRRIEIRKVEDFTGTNSDCINIKFSTINILHQLSDIKNIRENAVTLKDFEDTPLVLIGDEAHHLNAATKAEIDKENTWENSVQLVLKANSSNRLFEFTATANLTNKAIADKYENKLLYNYDLRHFRLDKFSKDVFTFSTEGDVPKIVWRALLISQYRKHIAADNRIVLKPVILFQSKTVAESKNNFENFKQFIADLSDKAIKSKLKKEKGNELWNKVVEYFTGKEKELCEGLKLDFDVSAKKVLLHDGTNQRIADQPKLLATLENDDNPVRAIFAVKMLQEGWDVLNLFDIVRLYNTRDGKYNRMGHYVAGNGTVSEAQLIGRGARYCPFPYKEGDKFKRKFDDNENEPLRVIEQMHYHCAHNPVYITEIKKALVESGILADEDIIEVTLKMKQDFIDGKYKRFQNKSVYVNQVFEKKQLNLKFDNGNVVDGEIIGGEIEEQKVVLLPNYSKDDVFNIHLSSGLAQSQALLDKDSTANRTGVIKSVLATLSELVPDHIIRHALNGNKNFAFDRLKQAFPKLKSMKQFVQKIGEKKVKVTHDKDIFSPDDKATICHQVLNHLAPAIKEERKKVIVTKSFHPLVAGKRFEQKIIRRYNKVDKSEKKYDQYNWYVYENSDLTSEEASFVQWFADDMMTKKTSGKTELEERGWSDIFLARNEKAVKLFSWFKENLGDGFEPDFVLFMKKDKLEYVFYIEPKGDWAYNDRGKDFGKEQWKENFLLEIEDVVSTQQAKMTDNKNWRLVGLPFFNKTNTKQRFADVFDRKTW